MNCEVVKITEKKISTSKIQMWGTVISVVLLLVISFQLNTLNDRLGTGSGQVALKAAPTQQAPSAPSPAAPNVDMEALVDDDAVKGDPDAPVTIVEFGDFECQFCDKFYSQTLDRIQTEYIDTGKVKFVYRDFPLSFHPNAQKAAEAAECAGDQDKFWEMHDKLFDEGAAGGVTSFKSFASDLGLDTGDFNDCLDSDTHAAEVQKDMRDGSAAGIRGTPGFIINGELLSGAQPFAAFQAAIEKALN
ncbi:DsbA family protein [Candidatus Woesearchaeota archaeon]|nr:DsbA family protein [Candidatus Woesearchaeota archaeon]